MGIGGQEKALWQTGIIAFETVTFLLEQLATARTARQPQQLPRTRRLKGAIDANLVGFKYVHDRSPFASDGAVAQMARTFSEALIDIHIICDNPTVRHPSKRASCQRRAKAQKDKIELVLARSLLQSLLNQPVDTAEYAIDVDKAQKKDTQSRELDQATTTAP